jgi:hypothetical protein
LYAPHNVFFTLLLQPRAGCAADAGSRLIILWEVGM